MILLQTKIFRGALMLSVALSTLGAFPAASHSEEEGEQAVWDFAALQQAPAHRWLDETSPIRSLLYTGDRYRGRDTEVFAFYATPATIAPDAADKPRGPFPAVVLIHGGGGTAFAEWVWLWAKRGYAAIAMDLSGHRPPAPEFDPVSGEFIPSARVHKRESRSALENGGPDQTHAEKFNSVGGKITDDWPWHAVGNAVRAHSLIRSFAEVDPGRTAVTGISWGGYTTCLVASIDPRFQAAVPVYGCGFLFEGESVQKKSIDALEPARRAEWIRRYDPSSHLDKCRVPILFVNGSHDVHYPLDSYQKTFDRVPGNKKQIRIQPRMGHSHPSGWKPKEIGLFIDSHCRGGPPLAKPGTPAVDGNGRIRVAVESGAPVTEATLHFTTEDGLRSKRQWQSVPAKIGGAAVSAPAPPAEANTWYFTLTDERGAMVSTVVQFSPSTR